MSFSRELKDFVEGYQAEAKQETSQQNADTATRNSLKSSSDKDGTADIFTNGVNRYNNLNGLPPIAGGDGVQTGAQHTNLATKIVSGVKGMFSGSQPASTTAPSGTTGQQKAWQDAIAGIESKGSGGYQAIGPATKQGDHAYGKYQVMGANVGPWTQEVLGKAMTPQEFLGNQNAQDAVFNAKFGNYVQKYGNPQLAAQAWFGGPGAVGTNRSDVLGTTVAGYGNKFASNLAGATGAIPAPITNTVASPTPVVSAALPAPQPTIQSAGQGTPVAQLDPTQTPAIPAPNYDSAVYSARGGMIRSGMVRKFADGGAVTNDDDDTGLDPSGYDAENAAPSPADASPAPVQGAIPTAPVQTSAPVNQAQDQAPTNPLAGLGKALHDGLTFLSSHFGFDQDQSNPSAIPDQGKQATLARFQNGEGAATPEEMAGIRKLIDPNGQLTTSQQQLAGMIAVHDYYYRKGDTAKAASSAASIVQYAKQQSAILGQQALDAIKSGNYQQAAQLVAAGYDHVPDGKSVSAKVNPDGTGAFVQRNAVTGQPISAGQFTPQQLIGAAMGLKDGTSYWKLLAAEAQNDDTYGDDTSTTSAEARAAAAKAFQNADNPKAAGVAKTSAASASSDTDDDGDDDSSSGSDDDGDAPAAGATAVTAPVAPTTTTSTGAIPTQVTTSAPAVATGNTTAGAATASTAPAIPTTAGQGAIKTGTTASPPPPATANPASHPAAAPPSLKDIYSPAKLAAWQNWLSVSPTAAKAQAAMDLSGPMAAWKQQQAGIAAQAKLDNSTKAAQIKAGMMRPQDRDAFYQSLKSGLTDVAVDPDGKPLPLTPLEKNGFTETAYQLSLSNPSMSTAGALNAAMSLGAVYPKNPSALSFTGKGLPNGDVLVTLKNGMQLTVPRTALVEINQIRQQRLTNLQKAQKAANTPGWGSKALSGLNRAVRGGGMAASNAYTPQVQTTDPSTFGTNFGAN